MELKPSTMYRYLISYQYFLYYYNLFKRSISKQRYRQFAGSVTENVAKLSFASERMQAAERAHNFVVDLCLHTTSTVVEALRCRSSFRSPPSRLTHQTLTQRDVEQSPLTVVDTGLCGRRPTLLSKAPRISSYSFSLTGT